MSTSFDTGLSDGIVKVAISDELAQRVADERLWSHLTSGRGSERFQAQELRKYQRNLGLNADRDMRRQIYAPFHGPWQQRPRGPRPGESTPEGLAKRERRHLRNSVAKRNKVLPSQVITDEAGKNVLYLPGPGKTIPAEKMTATRSAARHSPTPSSVIEAAVPKKPMSGAAKAGIAAAVILAALGSGYALHQNLSPKRYGHE